MTDFDKEEIHRTSVALYERHAEFIEQQHINFSSLTRDLLDEYMKYKQQDDEFEL